MVLLLSFARPQGKTNDLGRQGPVKNIGLALPLVPAAVSCEAVAIQLPCLCDFRLRMSFRLQRADGSSQKWKRYYCRKDACLAKVLSGGVGALGLVTATFLVEEGAKSVVLLSRRGVIGDELRTMWEKLHGFDIELLVKTCDVAKLSEVQALAQDLNASERRVRGLLHLAAVLDDATVPSLTRKHLERAYGAKVWGARHLRLCLHSKTAPLDFAVLFSSTSALLGLRGQGNYAAANTALDAQARYWKALANLINCT